jgi:hypothetical protein
MIRDCILPATISALEGRVARAEERCRRAHARLCANPQNAAVRRAYQDAASDLYAAEMDLALMTISEVA